MDLRLPVQSVPITTKVVSSNPAWWGLLDTTLCDKVCQWFSPSNPDCSFNKTDSHDIAEILSTVGSNTMNLNQSKTWLFLLYSPCFFLVNITFSILDLYHVILTIIHEYYSLPLILSYPKLVIFWWIPPRCVFIVSGIDLCLMFISESINLEKIHVNMYMINTIVHE